VLAAPELAFRKAGERIERAPIALTTSDGTGLQLIALEASTVIEDPLAFTELHLTFRNPEARRREGRFEITLPAQAAVSRFAMSDGTLFRDGEVVERRRAQQVYEDFLHRKQDPALLEKSAGNEFSARVFPIEPLQNKEIIIAYSEELPRRDTPYRLLIGGLPKLDELSIDVRVGSSSATGHESSTRSRAPGKHLTVHESDHVPSADIEVRLPWQKPLALRNGTLVAARVAPLLNLPDVGIDGLSVLFDTSASRALGFGAQIERLGALLSELTRRTGRDFELQLIAFDQTSEEIYRGSTGGFGLRDKAKLLARDALGASNLEQALTFLSKAERPCSRVLIVSDGVVTAGATDTTTLREAVAKLAAHGVRRVDVLAEGGIQDQLVLAELTRAGLANAGVVLDARMQSSQWADKLLKATQPRVEVQIAGATFVYPRVLEGVQSGDERIVFAELPADVPVQIELVGAGAEAFETLETPRPLLERAVARAKIDAAATLLRELSPDANAERTRLEREIVSLSLAHRVISDYTALLVLESEADYARFGIERSALTNVLRVGDEGIEVVDRVAQARQLELLHREGMKTGGAQPSALAEQDVLGELDDRVDRGQQPRADERKDAERARRAEPEATGSALARPTTGASSGAPTLGKREVIAPPRPSSPSPLPAAQAPAAARSAAASGMVREFEERAAPAKAKASANLGAGAELAADSAPSGARRPSLRGEPLQLAVPTALEAHAAIRLQSANGLQPAAAAPVLRGPLAARARQCYARSNADVPSKTLQLMLSITDKGSVTDANVSGGTLTDRAVQQCILAALPGLQFPKPDAGRASLQLVVELSMQPKAADPGDLPPALARPRPVVVKLPPAPALEAAYAGVLAEVLEAEQRGDSHEALARANAGHAQDPGDVIGLIALGEALEAERDYARAARAYGSLIDLFPSRADLRRMAAARLERLPEFGLALAVDSYRRALAQRPDHPAGQRALAYALLKQNDRAEAFEVLERALERSYPIERFEGVDRILREDLALVGEAWIRADASLQARVQASLTTHGSERATTPSTRFVLNWETDANDVDFHIYDGRGGHAYYMRRKLASGGALYADITTGYGPECFSVPGRARAYPYVLQAHYFARGPMGYGMGKLQVIEHDGQGGLKFGEHPFVIMKDKAFIELARLKGPLGS
jgi:tetratricopeptide (TPR) repeat protein